MQPEVMVMVTNLKNTILSNSLAVSNTTVNDTDGGWAKSNGGMDDVWGNDDFKDE